MKKTLEDILQHWGAQTQVVFPEETRSVRAWIQPVTGKSWRVMEQEVDALGMLPNHQFLYLGPADTDLTGSLYLEQRGCRYAVRTSRALYAGDEPLYHWGLLVQGGGDDPWNS